MRRGVSVVVCCYNSAERLPNTLDHLKRQQIGSDLPVEVIIVDNTSTDSTSTVALQEWKNVPVTAMQFSIVFESIPGLSEARRRGVAEAKYDYLLFCDDDNWLCDDYILRACKILDENPAIGVLGGRGEVVGDGEIPFWFSTFQGAYAVGCQALFSGDITSRKGVMGAGMMIRRLFLHDLIEAGCRPLLSDRKGDSLISGGDDEICRWYLYGGFKLWYDEDLVFQHYMPRSRLTKEYYAKLKQAQVQSYHLLLKYDHVEPKSTLLAKFRWMLRIVIKGLSHEEKVARRNLKIIANSPFRIKSSSR